ncbi:MAG: MoaF N-terminal domain-containing protein [Oscillospiraceae bacterium]|jgi:hypothetical protein|nr:MoaF N-terminal domain-containing protein [Oscillospiraceae bacterium]
MPRHTYPQFTPEEIVSLVEARKDYNTGGLDVNRPAFDESLSGRTLTLRYDNGRELTYAFKDAHALAWTENGASHVEYYETLKADDHTLLVVHKVDGSNPPQAHIVVLETDTRLVTTFFSKIGNAVSTREVDREIVFGYFYEETAEGAGKDMPAPEARHSLTRDLIGRSIIWTYGPKFTIQHIYASEWYSCFVDFNSFIGGAVLSSPCNYVKINDRLYIYSWVETEGAGIQGFALMNLLDMHDVGCFFGINGSGQFECYTFGAFGEDAGSTANLFIPNDYAVEQPWPPRLPKHLRETLNLSEDSPGDANEEDAPPTSGLAQIDRAQPRHPSDSRFLLRPYRPGAFNPDMTPDEIYALAERAVDGMTYNHGGLEGRRLPFTDALSGKTLTIALDDGAGRLPHTFVDRHRLTWTDADGVEHPEYYEAIEIDRNIFMVAYMRKGSRPVTSVTAVLDLGYNIATVITAAIGALPFARDVDQRILGGVILREGAFPPLAWRHQPTRDLIGKTYGWSYRDDMTSQHIYASPYGIAWVILQGPGAGSLGSAPCKYYKINDHVYLYSWIESYGSGQQGVVLMNTRTMHDCGTFYGFPDTKTFEFYTYGAKAYALGSFDTKERFAR